MKRSLDADLDGPRRKVGKKRRKRGRAGGAGPRAERPPLPEHAPYWLPNKDLWNSLPPAVCRAVIEVLTPAYQRLVRDAPDELERSAGISLMHLLWLEIGDQLSMSYAVADRESVVFVQQMATELEKRHGC